MESSPAYEIAREASDGPMPRPKLLALENVSKTFGGIPALNGVSFDLRTGEVHSLMGENGAGKSTLVRIMTGAHLPDPGSIIRLEGQPVVFRGPLEARAAGISAIYQDLSLAENLTVAENMFLAREPRRFGHADRTTMRTRAEPILAELGAQFGADAIVGTLKLAERQLVEIARVLQAGARVVIMDEPTTSLSRREAERLFGVVERLRSKGVGIVYISHRMDEVFALSDRATVLRDGRYVGTLERGEIDPERLVRMMVGRDLSTLHSKAERAQPVGEPVLEVEDVRAAGLKADCTFTLRRHEILGIAGLVGSGRTELAHAIAGIAPRSAGRIAMEGLEIEISEPLDAINAGIAYLTEDRRSLGLFLSMSVRDNINLLTAAVDSLWGVVRNFPKARSRSHDAISALSIRLADDRMDAGLLSGGNQQKVLLARLLQTDPKVVILDEPTRGIDLGAKSSIYRIIEDLAQRGVGVIVISSDLPEIIGTADRVLVMREGAIAGEVGEGTGTPVTEENIMRLAAQARPREGESAHV